MVAALLSQIEEVRRTSKEAGENAAKAQESERKLRALFENAPVGMYQSTPQGRYLLVNPEFASIFGYDSPEELISCVTDIHSMIWVEQHATGQYVADIGGKKTRFIDYEARNLRKDGSIIWTSRNLRAVRDADGTIKMYDGFISDITAPQTRRRRVDEPQP